MDMGERIKKARKTKGWSQTELAEKIGLTPGGMSGIESNKKDASQTTIVKLSKVLEVSADYLLFGTESERTISESEQEIINVLRNDKEITNTLIEMAKLKKKVLSYARSYQSHQEAMHA